MCGESCMHGVERGKIRRLHQKITYRYLVPMLMCHKVTQEFGRQPPTIPLNHVQLWQVCDMLKKKIYEIFTCYW